MAAPIITVSTTNQAPNVSVVDNNITIDQTTTSVTVSPIGTPGRSGFTGSGGSGFTGSQGVAGFTGSASDVIGFTGSQGSGFTGSQGIQGVTGFTGSQGNIGFTGSQGIQGVTGFVGSASDVIGFTGSEGAQGTAGFTGSQGIQGVTGFVGSASDVIGFTGSQGDIGFTGSIGPDGTVYASNVAPIAPDPGDLWWHTEEGQLKLYYYDGDSIQWVDAAGGAGPRGFTGSQGAGFTGSASDVIGFTGSQGEIGFTGSLGPDGTVYTSNVAPITPDPGDLWWHTEEGQLKLYYDDGDTIQWVDAAGGAGPRGFTGSIGFVGSQGTVYRSPTAPVSPLAGDLWWDTTDGQLKIYFDDVDSSQWVEATGGSIGPDGPIGFTGSQGVIGFTGSQGVIGFTGSASDVIGFSGSQGTVYRSPTAPVSPLDGDLWWDSVNGQLRIYFDDGDSSQWVEATGGSIGPDGPIGFTGSASTVIGFTGSQATIGGANTQVQFHKAAALAGNSNFTYDEANSQLAVNGSLVLSNATGSGIKVDTASPAFGWRDITSDIQARGIGVNDPTFAIYTGTVLRAYQFSASTEMEVFSVFHIPHDYVPGSNIHLHTHWSNAAATPDTGNVVWAFDYAFAKGFNQEAFPAVQTVKVTQASPATRYQHMIAETAAVSIPALEVDGILLVRIYRDAANVADTCTDAVFLHTADIHYQSTNMTTKNKAPNFYT